MAAALGATVWVLAYRGAPTAFDEWLALPIALETARPGTYPPGDLLVHGSMDAPFHLYKAASLLYTFGLNVDVAWYALLALSLVAFLLAVWRLGRALGLTEAERLVTLFAIAASPVYRGTLNWSAQPMLSFISASVAVPLGVYAMAAALEGSAAAALVSAAVAFDVHPSLGLCAGVGVLTVLLMNRPWRTLLRGAALALAVALPNAVYLLRHRPMDSAVPDARLWSVVRQFGYHIFVSDHWRDGYPWYALCLALAFVGAARLGSQAARTARVAAAVLTAVAVGWIAVINVAHLPAVVPFYLIRASLLVKPLMLGLAVVAVARRSAWTLGDALTAVAAVLAVVHPNPVVGEAALAAALGGVLRGSTRRLWRAVSALALLCAGALLVVVVAGHLPALAFVSAWTDGIRLGTLAVGVTVAVLTFGAHGAPAAEPRPGAQSALVWVALALPALGIVLARPPGRAWLPDSWSRIRARMELSQPLQREAGAMRWARDHSPPGSLFAVPPVDVNWVRFRTVARRGEYASVHDVNQLMYTRARLFPELDRLATLGVVVRGPHEFDGAAYRGPTCARLERLAAAGVTHYVLPVGASIPAGVAPVYGDSSYQILDVPRAAAACR